MKRTFSGVTAALALAVQAFAGGVATADPGAATHVDSVSAAAGPSTVSVTGSATFVDIPKVVGEDGADALVPGIGTDVSSLTISRVAPNGRIHFTLGINDQPATLNGIPETIAYYWDTTVQTGGSDSGYELWSARSAQNQALGSLNPVFVRYTCALNPDTGINECGNDISVPGRMQDGVVEWQVSPSQINAQPGSVITGGAVEVSPTASGLFWGVLRLDGSGAIQFDDYVVPGATVQLGIAPEGTPQEFVPLSQSATVNMSNSSFNGFLPKPAESGSYIVVAKACFGADSCGTSSTTVTI